MQILMVTMSLGIGGAETHIVELARGLVAAGHRVTVAASGGLYVEALTAAGVRFVEAPLHSKRPDKLARAYRTLSRLVREEPFDVIHAHARIPGFLASFIARRADVPFVTTFHGVFNPVWYWRMLTRTGERTLAVSDDVHDYLRRYYDTPEEQITVTVNGIDTAVFGGPASAGRAGAPFADPSRPTILCVSRLDRESAAHIFPMIEAMPAVAEAAPGARLVIVGGGDVLDEVRAAAARMNTVLGEGAVTVAGPRTDVAAILPAADVFVGVSRAAMEAMACRVPVVLSGAQGHLGVFGPALEAEAKATNFCCRGRETADAGTLAAAVSSVLAMPPEARRALGAFGRALIERDYSVGRMVGDAETLYARAVRGHVFRRADVIVSGYYGYGNAGDDALLGAIADGLRARGIYRIAALCRSGRAPAPGVRAIRRFRFLTVRREIRRAKLLLSGGGSLLQDATSTKSLIYYTSVIRAAEAAGVPVMIYANGIGPLTRPANVRRAARAVRGAAAVSVRERASGEELVKMGIPSAAIRVSADPVFTLPAPTPAASDAPYLLLSLRETADGRRGAAMEDAVFAAVRDLCRAHALGVVLLPMQPAYDDAVCGRVAARLREAGLEVTLLAGASVDGVRAAIAGARAVVAMRLHALIFACAAAVPALALSYDPKIDAFMDYMDLSGCVLEAFSADSEAIRLAGERLLAERERVACALRTRRDEMRALAEADLDAAAALLAGKDGRNS